MGIMSNPLLMAAERISAAGNILSLKAGIRIDINPVQSGSGDPSPSNVRPISGWQSVGLYAEEQYNAQATPKSTITIPAPPGTVYGCYIEVLEDGTARLVVTHGNITFVGDVNEGWTKVTYATKERYLAPMPSDCVDPPIQTTDGLYTDWIKPSTTSGDYCGAIISGSRYNCYLPLNTTDFNTLYHFRTYLSTHNLHVVYPLATPVTYTLDPFVIPLVSGPCNLWADSGDIKLSIAK